MRFISQIAVVLAAILAAGPAHAGSEIDIHLQVIDGRIVTGLIDASSGAPLLDQSRVFAGTFGEAAIHNFTNDPGFFAPSGTFPIGSSIGFNILAALRVWTGGGFAPTGGETMRLAFSTLSVTTGGGFVAGFSLAVSPNGGYHRHLSFFLDGPPDGQPAPGVYLLELEKFSSSPAIAPSEPFWIVFNYQQPGAVHDAAVMWAQRHLAAPPPCSADCPADLNNDGAINGLDLGILLINWSIPPAAPGCASGNGGACCSDLNSDSLVNGLDLGVLLGSWGLCP